MEQTLIAFSQVTKATGKLRGDTLFSCKAPPENLYYLEQGFAKITRTNGDKHEAIFAFLGPGSICGDSLHFGESAFRYSACMLTDGIVREIPLEVYAHFCRSDARAWRWVAELEARRRTRLEKRIEIMCIADARRRLMALIPFLVLQYKFPRQEDGSYVLPLKQSEFASLIGSTRETTSSMLNNLARANLIRLGRGRLIVPDLKAFEYD